jgi:hypothetical protein
MRWPSADEHCVAPTIRRQRRLVMAQFTCHSERPHDELAHVAEVIIGPSEDKTARHQKQSGRGRLSAADKHLTQPACTPRHGRGSAGLNAMDRNIYARAGYWTLVKLTGYFLICASSLLPQQLRQLGPTSRVGRLRVLENAANAGFSRSRLICGAK